MLIFNGNLVLNDFYKIIFENESIQIDDSTLKRVVEDAFEVLAIEIITIVQAIECLKVQDKVSSKTKKMYEDIRNIVPIFTNDVVMYPYVNQAKSHITNNKLN